MPELPIHNNSGKQVEIIEIPENIFGQHVNSNVIHQAVVMYQAATRQGNASTKERGAVSGGGKKPYRQKGTGRARAGSSRSPLWHKGGVVFGPHPRDFRFSIPKKIRSAALRESMNAKMQSKDIFCIDQFADSFIKTKDFAKFLKGLKLNGKVLALIDTRDEKFERVSRNIPYFKSILVKDVNAYDVLRSKKILISKAAFQTLLERIK